MITNSFTLLLQPLFAYECREHYEENGWHVYDAVAELKRQGVPNETWSVCRLNDKYGLCDTYPTVVSDRIQT